MRRKRPRAAKVLLAFSVLLASTATLLLRGHLQQLEARAAAAGPGRPVVVAAVDLTRGSAIGPQQVRIERIPERFTSPGALRSTTTAVGRTAGTDIQAGEPITTSRLAPAGGPVAALVPRGLRAVGVGVGVPPGPLAPGDRVDVLATYAGGQPHTETVVTAAEVLMVQGSDDPGGGGTAVVLLVWPGDAERLAYARAFADLSIAVVSPAETL